MSVIEYKDNYNICKITLWPFIDIGDTGENALKALVVAGTVAEKLLNNEDKYKTFMNEYYYGKEYNLYERAYHTWLGESFFTFFIYLSDYKNDLGVFKLDGYLNKYAYMFQQISDGPLLHEHFKEVVKLLQALVLHAQNVITKEDYETIVLNRFSTLKGETSFKEMTDSLFENFLSRYFGSDVDNAVTKIVTKLLSDLEASKLNNLNMRRSVELKILTAPTVDEWSHSSFRTVKWDITGDDDGDEIDLDPVSASPSPTSKAPLTEEKKDSGDGIDLDPDSNPVSVSPQPTPKAPLTEEKKDSLAKQTELLLDLQAGDPDSSLSVKIQKERLRIKLKNRTVGPAKYQGENTYNTVDFDIEYAIGKLSLKDQYLLKLPHEQLGEDLDKRLKHFGLDDFDYTESKFIDADIVTELFEKGLSLKDHDMQTPMVFAKHPAFTKNSAWDDTFLKGFYSTRPADTKNSWWVTLMEDKPGQYQDLEPVYDYEYRVESQGGINGSILLYTAMLYAIPELVNSFYLDKKVVADFKIDAVAGEHPGYRGIPYKYIVGMQKALSKHIKKGDKRSITAAAAIMFTLSINYDKYYDDVQLENVDINTQHKNDLETLNKVLTLNGVGLRVTQIDVHYDKIDTIIVGDKSKVLTDVELYVDDGTNFVSVHFIQPSLAEENLKETKKMRKSALNRFYNEKTALGRINPAHNGFDVDKISSFERVIETVEKGWVIDTPVKYDIKKIRAVNRYD